ncbi:hypothetical protein [Streptomyces sp. NPDC057403]|uniref:hypothetical protein n=1 Tax=Streptomyces sp. NPDC057403 TaxID=3346119 RepID=UPI00367C2B48
MSLTVLRRSLASRCSSSRSYGVKLEGVQPMLWAVGLMEKGHNPARHIKDGDATLYKGE